MQEFDIAIVGAGPAGCAAALALRRENLRVVLIDMDTFPRDKICGDAIPGPAFRVMRELDPVFGERMRAFGGEARVISSKGFTPGGHALEMHWKSFSYNAKREDFDNFLYELVREEGRVTDRTGCQVRRIERRERGLEIELGNGERLGAKLILGCDGANSIVARQLATFDAGAAHRGTAVRAYYRHVAGVQPGMNEFHFLADIPFGYLWIFPLADGWANVGLGVLREKDPGKPRLNLRKELDRILAENPNFSGRFAGAERMDKTRGFALPFCNERQQMSGAGYLLCGDAASLVSPLWGHGIDTAMRSGVLAAGRAVEALRAGDYSATALRAYDEAVYRRIGRDFIRSNRYLRVARRLPFLLPVAWSLLRYERTVRWVLRRLRMV